MERSRKMPRRDSWPRTSSVRIRREEFPRCLAPRFWITRDSLVGRCLGMSDSSHRKGDFFTIPGSAVRAPSPWIELTDVCVFACTIPCGSVRPVG